MIDNRIEITEKELIAKVCNGCICSGIHSPIEKKTIFENKGCDRMNFVENLNVFKVVGSKEFTPEQQEMRDVLKQLSSLYAILCNGINAFEMIDGEYLKIINKYKNK